MFKKDEDNSNQCDLPLVAAAMGAKTLCGFTTTVSHTSVTLRHMRLSVVIPRIIILVNISIAIIAGDDLMEEESLDNGWCLSHFGIPRNPMCSIQHLAMHCIGYSLNLAISSTTVLQCGIKHQQCSVQFGQLNSWPATADA